MGGRAYFRSALGGFVLGVTLYAGSDVANDLLTYRLLRSAARQLADEDQELLRQIGSPLGFGPWYNSSIGFTHRGHIAHCTFQLAGSKQITDVNVKGIRGPGHASNLLYNTLGASKWELMACQAMMPAGGGTVKPRSLLKAAPAATEQQQSDAAATHAAAAAEQAPGQARPPAAVRGAGMGEQQQQQLGQQESQQQKESQQQQQLGQRQQQQQQQQQQLGQQQAAGAQAAQSAGQQQGKTWWQWLLRQ
jgi:hypothetical protein